MKHGAGIYPTGGGAALAGNGEARFVVGSGASGGRIEVYCNNSVYDCTAPIGDNVLRLMSSIELAIGDWDAHDADEIIVIRGQSPFSTSGFYVYRTDCVRESPQLESELFPGAFYGARMAIGKVAP